MMKHLNDLTFRYLIRNKRRTIFTLIGIILSMILITLGCVFMPTAQKVMLDEARSYKGSWHIKYNNVDGSFIDKIKANPKVEASLALSNDESIKIKSATLVLNSYNGDLSGLLPIKLKEGRFPENYNEVLIEDWVPGRLEKEITIGDKIDFNGRLLNVVGFLYGDPSQEESNAYVKEGIENETSLLVKLKEDRNFRENLAEFEGKNGDNSTNAELTRILAADKDYYLYNTIIYGVTVFIAIILISTVAIIYNSFNISILQRNKEIAILRTVGSTPKQIRRLVRREAIILATIGIPVGILLGLVLFQLLVSIFNELSSGLRILNGTEKIKMVLEYKYIFLSLFIGFITIYISSLVPAKKAGNTSPLEALNCKSFIKKDNIKRQRGRLVKLFFKIDKVMAYRNLKRSKGRYRITIFSMSLSVIIFFVISTFSISSKSMINVVDNLSRDINIITYVDIDDESEFNKFNDTIEVFTEVEKSFVGYNPISYTTLIPVDKVNKDSLNSILEFSDIKVIEVNNEEYFPVSTQIGIYDEKRLEATNEYLFKDKIDKDALNNGEVLIINNGKSYVEGIEEKREITTLKSGDYLNISLVGSIMKDEFKITENGVSISSRGVGGDGNKSITEEDLLKVKIAGVLDIPPFDLRLVNSLGIIMTPETANSWLSAYYTEDKMGYDKVWIEDNKVKKDYLEIVLKDPSYSKAVTSKIEDLLLENGIKGEVVDLANISAKEKTTVLLINILGGGFAIIIGLIGAVNIFNTVNTNISLRKREFISLISIGMPMNKICNIVMLEGVFYGVISSIIGGSIGGAICYNFLNRIGLYGSVLKEIFILMLISIIFTVGFGIISTLPGVRKLRKMNIIEELKMDN